MISSKNFSISWNMVLPFSLYLRKIWNKLTGLSPFPYLFSSIICEKPQNDFSICFGLKGTVIVLDCDGVASGRVCYQYGHPFSLPTIIKLFLVLRWDQSAKLKSFKNIFHTESIREVSARKGSCTLVFAGGVGVKFE